MEFDSVRPEFEDLAESGGGTGVDEEGAFFSVEVFPVSAAERRQAVDRNKALVTLPPETKQTEKITFKYTKSEATETTDTNGNLKMSLKPLTGGTNL